MLSVEQSHETFGGDGPSQLQLRGAATHPTARCGATSQVVVLTRRQLPQLLQVVVLRRLRQTQHLRLLSATGCRCVCLWNRSASWVIVIIAVPSVRALSVGLHEGFSCCGERPSLG